MDRIKVYLLPERERKRRRLQAYRRELEQRERAGAPRWIREWFEREIQKLEEELKG